MISGCRARSGSPGSGGPGRSQAAAEVAANILTKALAGINLSQGVGTMAGGSYRCLAMAVIGDELIGMAKRFGRGIRVNDESLALDLIG